jgi:hypothetical protein
MARSISEALRMLAVTSIPSGGAMDWMAANWAGPEESAGSVLRRNELQPEPSFSLSTGSPVVRESPARSELSFHV